MYRPSDDEIEKLSVVKKGKNKESQKKLNDEDEYGVSDEKDYDRILEHVRLSSTDRPNSANYYAHKINQLAEQGNV
jgi:hypothetical protein